MLNHVWVDTQLAEIFCQASRVRLDGQPCMALQVTSIKRKAVRMFSCLSFLVWSWAVRVLHVYSYIYPRGGGGVGVLVILGLSNTAVSKCLACRIALDCYWDLGRRICDSVRNTQTPKALKLTVEPHLCF